MWCKVSGPAAEPMHKESSAQSLEKLHLDYNSQNPQTSSASTQTTLRSFVKPPLSLQSTFCVGLKGSQFSRTSFSGGKMIGKGKEVTGDKTTSCSILSQWEHFTPDNFHRQKEPFPLWKASSGPIPEHLIYLCVSMTTFLCTLMLVDLPALLKYNRIIHNKNPLSTLIFGKHLLALGGI